MISAIGSTSDGDMDEVHEKRNQWGADMVALLTSKKVKG